ncbi:hypothetical protein ABBQ38_008117 [Trebouxia sp. C0009 RCD-2024]
MRACLQTAVKRLVRRQLLAAWASWREAVQLSRNKKANAQRALAYMTTSSQSRALTAWTNYLHGRVAKQHQTTKATVHFTRAAIVWLASLLHQGAAQAGSGKQGYSCLAWLQAS